jgi:cell wall-associated NlpC family hydrolase/nucleoid-associated protein YgaU
MVDKLQPWMGRLRRVGEYLAPRARTIATRYVNKSVTRSTLHVLVVIVGLLAATSVWYGPRAVGQQPQFSATAAAPHSGIDRTLAERIATWAMWEPQPVRVRRVNEGDTLRSIAAEHSVSISTILASNKIQDPDKIVAGQDLLIPPVEGLIADVMDSETLGQIAERFHADLVEVALANGLPVESDLEIPYERVLIPGIEPAERIAMPGRARPGYLASHRESDDSGPARPSALTYEVQDGDTLAQLSAQFGVNVWTLLNANNIANPDSLKPGAVLRVPLVNGVEHDVLAGESLFDIAKYYEVDLGLLIDFNGIGDPTGVRIGDRLMIPGADKVQPNVSLANWTPPLPVPISIPSLNLGPPRQAPAQAPAPVSRPAVVPQPQRQPAPAPAVRPQPAPQVPTRPAPATAIQAPARPSAPIAAPIAIPSNGRSGGGVAASAMRYLGARYAFGGTSPAGFDCSGFVWFVHQSSGRPISRGMWGQLNGGARVPMAQLQPGDTVFFANTYMPGLSHNGVYIGGGRFVHASDESSGVKISSLSDGYWGPRYVGASRLW